MGKLGLSVAVAALASIAQPAAAAVTVVYNEVVLSGSGGSWTVNYDGYGENPGLGVIPGLSSKIEFTFVNFTNGGKTANLTYTITNNSALDSRLSVFGFLTSAPLSAATTSSSQPFDLNLVGSFTLPNAGQLPISVCFKDQGQGNNCNNGQAGVDDGVTTAVGTIALGLQNAVNQLALSNWVVRYQSTATTSGSAIGRGTVLVNGVPEPATWAMMIGGFGLLGTTLRRRRRAIVAAA